MKLSRSRKHKWARVGAIACAFALLVGLTSSALISSDQATAAQTTPFAVDFSPSVTVGAPSSVIVRLAPGTDPISALRVAAEISVPASGFACQSLVPTGACSIDPFTGSMIFEAVDGSGPWMSTADLFEVTFLTSASATSGSLSGTVEDALAFDGGTLSGAVQTSIFSLESDPEPANCSKSSLLISAVGSVSNLDCYLLPQISALDGFPWYVNPLFPREGQGERRAVETRAIPALNSATGTNWFLGDVNFDGRVDQDDDALRELCDSERGINECYEQHASASPRPPVVVEADPRIKTELLPEELTDSELSDPPLAPADLSESSPQTKARPATAALPSLAPLESTLEDLAVPADESDQ